MRRLKCDRGAVAVIVALMMIPILVCAALVIDVGAAYVRRAQMQTAADAGALAIAQDCAGPTGCGNPSATVTNFVTKNVSSMASADVPIISGNSVKVTVKSEVDYAFAPIIGIDSRQVVATSAASWGAPIGGRSVLPITFSWCSFKKQTGGGVPSPTTTSIRFTKEDDSGCTGPSGNAVPGGFGWVLTDSGKNCAVTSTSIPANATNILWSDTGASRPCSDSYFAALLPGTAGPGRTVLLPLFDKAGGTGSGAWYQVYAYAAFRLSAFHFQGSHNWIEGYFVKFVEPSDAFTYGAGAPDLGARVVYLTS